MSTESNTRPNLEQVDPKKFKTRKEYKIAVIKAIEQLKAFIKPVVKTGDNTTTK